MEEDFLMKVVRLSALMALILIGLTEVACLNTVDDRSGTIPPYLCSDGPYRSPDPDTPARCH